MIWFQFRFLFAGSKLRTGIAQKREKSKFKVIVVFKSAILHQNGAWYKCTQAGTQWEHRTPVHSSVVPSNSKRWNYQAVLAIGEPLSVDVMNYLQVLKLHCGLGCGALKGG